MSTYPSAPPLTSRFMQVSIPDVSTADSVWVVPGFRGRIRKIHSVVDAAISVADAAITVEVNGVAVAGAALTIESTSSAAGDVASATVPILGSTNHFDEGDAIEVITDGGSTTASKATITLEAEPF